MKAYANWIISGVAILLALVAIIRTPPDLSVDLQLVYQDMLHGDSLLIARQDSLVLAASKADSILRTDVQAELMNQAKTLADSVRVMRIAMSNVQKSMVSVGELKKIEQVVKITAQKSDFTESELQLLREAFDDYKAVANISDKKVASSAGKQRQGFFWR